MAVDIVLTAEDLQELSSISEAKVIPSLQRDRGMEMIIGYSLRMLRALATPRLPSRCVTTHVLKLKATDV